MRLALSTLPLLVLATVANAQTRTITTGQQTVVVGVSTNAAGNPVTSTIRTLGATGPDNPDHVVGQPPNTNGPAEPTVYWVTSFDDAGNTIVDSFIFTPSFAPSSPPVQYPEGTIYDYNSWSAQFATATFVPSLGNRRVSQSPIVGLGVTLFAAITGALLVLH